MINIKFCDEIYSIKNKTNEITINEFENIIEIIFKNSDDEIDKWIEIFKYLGLPQKVCDNFNYSDLLILSSHYTFINQNLNLKIIKSKINLKGKSFKFINPNKKIKVKDLIKIDSYCEKNKFKYLAEIMSVLYPTNDDNIEHISNIREFLTIDNILPIINILSKKYIYEN